MFFRLNSKFALTRTSCCLLERIACCIAEQESILLVGETGVGKTSVLQLLAKYTGNKLIVLNMNQQSDTVDLVGGYKPVELKVIVKPIQEEFESLFRAEFNIQKNKAFLNHISVNHYYYYFSIIAILSILSVFIFIYICIYCFRYVLIFVNGQNW